LFPARFVPESLGRRLWGASMPYCVASAHRSESKLGMLRSPTAMKSQSTRYSSSRNVFIHFARASISFFLPSTVPHCSWTARTAKSKLPAEKEPM
jgi:hypothetical protein